MSQAILGKSEQGVYKISVELIGVNKIISSSEYIANGKHDQW